MEPTLLLVDDEQNVLTALRRVFEDDNYNILTATSGAEGLRLLEENAVQIVISDQSMPNMTGTEFLTQVKKLSPETIRILLTGYSDFDAVKNAINEGNIFKYITKPWDNDLLHTMVQEALEAYSNQNKSKETIEREAKAEVKRLQDEFLANMSHEIRTPLTGIIGFAKILSGGVLDPNSAKHREFLQQILASSQNLSHLLTNVLDLTQSAKTEFNPKPTDVNQLMNEVKDMLQHDIASKNTKVEIKIDPTLTNMMIDADQLKKVLCHYLSNAIKFTHDAGNVEISFKPEGEHFFRIDVKDDGIGIHPDEIKNLFLPFKQLDMSTTKKHPGAGLGLALVKRIVEAQNGKVSVESVLGEGSTFSIILPLIQS